MELAERVSGDTTVGHALAFCQAVEDACGLDVAADAQRVRGVLLELERLYNHITDIGALCNDVGYGILNSHAQRVREQLLRINDEVAGNRLLRGVVHIGGTSVATLPDPAWLAQERVVVPRVGGQAARPSRFTGPRASSTGPRSRSRWPTRSFRTNKSFNLSCAGNDL